MWRRGFGAIFGLLPLFTGCSGTQGETCALYACVNEARLTGSVAFPTVPSALDVSRCMGGRCEEGVIDLSGPTDGCTHSERSSVCLELRGTGFELSADWAVNEDGTVPPDSTEYRVTLTDHSNGEVLLDASRTMTYAISRQDNCHVCWSGHATL